jgi:hypothetical protein
MSAGGHPKKPAAHIKIDRKKKGGSKSAAAHEKAERYKKYKNLFERYDIDPRQGTRAITERMRELAEDASTDEERAELRATWEELTVHPARRLRAAFGAHPESRPPIGAPPPTGGAAAGPVDPDLTLSELAVRPSIARALGGGPSVLGPKRDGARGIAAAAAPPENLDDDPILKRVPDVR